MKISIQKDLVLHRNGERQSYSGRWIERARSDGIQVKVIDAFKEPVTSISDCDGFMWRPSPSAYSRLYAKRLLPAIEHGLAIPTFPDWRTLWHFEDKIAQHYLLTFANIPAPSTFVAWDRAQALEFAETTAYPFVLKLASGFQSANVRLIKDRDEAKYFVDQLFGPGVTGLGYGPASSSRRFLRRLRMAGDSLAGRSHPNTPSRASELQHGYFYAQEFLPRNDFDVRITVIGNRAFGFRRFNRTDDFRASGSGKIDWDPAAIPEDMLRLAFRTSRILGAQTVAIDGLRKESQPVVSELTLTYASWAVRDCPGHWVLNGGPGTGTLHWVEGAMLAEDAIYDDFIAQVKAARTPHPLRDAGE